jgi:heparan-alpha-glucosaminide N-acetyltransferase
MNKPLYTISYTLATAGSAGLLFAGIYTLVSPLKTKPTNIYMKALSIISEISW